MRLTPWKYYIRYGGGLHQTRLSTACISSHDDTCGNREGADFSFIGTYAKIVYFDTLDNFFMFAPAPTYNLIDYLGIHPGQTLNPRQDIVTMWKALTTMIVKMKRLSLS